MSHDDFAFEPAPGLPAALPAGEKLLWQGIPRWRSLAVRAYHVRKVALYFAALILWDVLFGIAKSHPPRDILVSCGLLVAFGSIAIGVLSALAYFTSRSTVYSITSRRVLMRHGIAVPLTMNIPFNSIDGAAVRLFANGTGDIALQVAKQQRVAYLITWPHLRPGHLTRPQPSLRALSDAQHAAALLAEALAADAQTNVIAAPTSVEPRPAEPRQAEPRQAEPRTPLAHPAGSRALGSRPTAIA